MECGDTKGDLENRVDSIDTTSVGRVESRLAAVSVHSFHG